MFHSKNLACFWHWGGGEPGSFKFLIDGSEQGLGMRFSGLNPVRAEGGGFTKQSPIGYLLIYPIKEPAGVWRQVQYPHNTGSYLRTSIFKHIELGGPLQVLFKKETWTSTVLCFLSNKSRWKHIMGRLRLLSCCIAFKDTIFKLQLCHC
jgi:hypothetical protein